PVLRAKFQPLLDTALHDAKTSAPTRNAALRALPLMGAENARANFVSLAEHLERDLPRHTAARAIVQIPRDSWVPAVARPTVESVLAWARTVPAGDRTQQSFIEIAQAATELAGLLPPADATLLRKEFRSLGVSVFVIKTVREQMRYDTARLVVEVGKPLEVILENTDAMPHNIVFVQPGSRQEVAEAAQNMKPDALDKQGRAFIPKDHPKIIAASKLVEPDQKETLKIKAPATEGEYEYVCTLPGHWAIMWGKLIVTKDVDAYLQAHPVADAAPVGAPHDHSQLQRAALAK
ncbi:MAG: plastocyanin/azurin family copper-binding protein, partial [Chthoniobacteraceae bacterium]